MNSLRRWSEKCSEVAQEEQCPQRALRGYIAGSGRMLEGCGEAPGAGTIPARSPRTRPTDGRAPNQRQGHWTAFVLQARGVAVVRYS